MTTGQRRQVVTTLLAAYPVSARRACRLIGLARSRWQYRSSLAQRTPKEFTEMLAEKATSINRLSA